MEAGRRCSPERSEHDVILASKLDLLDAQHGVRLQHRPAQLADRVPRSGQAVKVDTLSDRKLVHFTRQTGRCAWVLQVEVTI